MRTYEITRPNGVYIRVEAHAALVNEGGCLLLMEETERGGKRMFSAYAAGEWLVVDLVDG